jgi:hypothetical protein
MVFHSPQLSQRPLHFDVTAPQLWQTKRLTGRAIAQNIFRPAGIGRSEYACCNKDRPCAHFRSDGTAPVGRWDK